jgi:hypothetical protein
VAVVDTLARQNDRQIGETLNEFNGQKFGGDRKQARSSSLSNQSEALRSSLFSRSPLRRFPDRIPHFGLLECGDSSLLSSRGTAIARQFRPFPRKRRRITALRKMANDFIWRLS